MKQTDHSSELPRSDGYLVNHCRIIQTLATYNIVLLGHYSCIYIQIY